MTELMKASNQWATRPDDERFLSLQELYESALDDHVQSQHKVVDNKEIFATANPENEAEGLKIQYRDVTLTPSNWAFGQLCTQADAPAKYIKKLTPAFAAINFNYCMQRFAPQDEVKIFVKNGEMLRASNGREYGYIPNYVVAGEVIKMNDATGGRWKIPSASYSNSDPRRATTLYKGDRNEFIFLVDPEYTIEFTGTNGKREQLFRGFFMENSEVGANVVAITTFLYRYVCDNRIVWGAENVKEVRMRHSKFSPERFASEMPKYLMEYANSSPKLLESNLHNAAIMEFPRKESDGIEWLMAKSFTKNEATKIIASAYNEEGGASSLWDIVNGGTALARSIQNADTRVDFEKKVSGLLKLAA